MEHYLVRFTCHSGEYEFSGQTVITLTKPWKKLAAAVHRYFKDFYGKENFDDFTKNESYSYLGGEVAVDGIYWELITPAQRQVLKDLNIA
jgi:hypothetical protein